MRKKMSSMISSQFETDTRQISSLDRCNLCGRPRSAHGADWSCSPAGSPRGTLVVTALVVAGLLALAGIGLLAVTSATGTTLGSLGAAGVLAGLVVIVCGAAVSLRRQ
jgi:hypothetical protein